MYPPPPKEILLALTGNILDVVAFAKYVINLNFEGGNRIGIAAPFKYGKPSEIDQMDFTRLPIDSSNLITSLQSAVTDVKCDADGTLELAFADGYLLIIYANDPQYEAYTLTINGKDYVV